MEKFLLLLLMSRFRACKLNGYWYYLLGWERLLEEEVRVGTHQEFWFENFKFEVPIKHSNRHA